MTAKDIGTVALVVVFAAAPRSTRSDTPSRIGKEPLSFVGVDPNSWTFPTKDFAHLADFKAIGTNFYGLEFFGWNGIQPERRGPYRWQTFDAQVKAIERVGGEILFKMWSGSRWASSIRPIRGRNRALPSSPIKPEFLGDFKKFVKAVVERYDGDGAGDMPGLQKAHLFYQFEGEPDSFFLNCQTIRRKVAAHWCGTPQEYNRLVKMFHDAVKEANARALVLSPSTMFNDIFSRNFDRAEFHRIVNSRRHMDAYKRYRFIRALLSQGSHFDIVAVQGNKNYEGILPWIRWVRTLVPEKEIWIVDAAAGYVYAKHKYSRPRYRNEEKIERALRHGDVERIRELGFKDYDELLCWALAEQSKSVFKKIVVAAVAGVKHIFLQWPFESERPGKGWVNVGLLEDNVPKGRYPLGTPRPAFYSTKQFMETIGRFDSVTDLHPLPEGVDPLTWTWIVKFSRQGQVVFVLWSDSGSKTVDLSPYVSAPRMRVARIVTELGVDSKPIYPRPEIVPTDSIPIDETPRFAEREKKEMR